MKPGERFLRQEPEKYFAVRENWVLRGVTLSRQGNEWRMIVKVTKKKEGHQNCYIYMSTPYDCWTYLYQALTQVNAPLKWSTDNYEKSP